MNLYLVRHGDSASAATDDMRPLSEKGQADIHRLATFLAPLNIKVTAIYHSEKLRAQQTAKILAPSFSSKTSLQARPELDPLYPITSIIDESYSWNGNMLLVGHMPYMGKLAAKLLSHDETTPIIAFKPGCMLCLERIEANQWALNWMLSPEIIS